MSEQKLSFETRAVHGGADITDDFRPTAPPIHPSTTFTYDDIEKVHAALGADATGFAYSRNANPTVRGLEQAIASLEETEEAVAFGSGMAAIHAAILASGVRPGQTIVAADQLYGGSRSLISSLFGDLGFDMRLVNTRDLDAVKQSMAGAGALLFEPISNPLMTVSDVEALAGIAHAEGAAVIVDNTFASPVLLRPALVGADFVVESATKYLGGHGDVTAGLVCGTKENMQRVRVIRTASGGILSPFDAWLVLRGLRTLTLRVQRQCASALALAMWLSSHRKVGAVHYPGLSTDPGHDVATRQFESGLFGGMLSFETDLDSAGAIRFLGALSLAVPGTSLGDVVTLMLHPAQTSHRHLTPEERGRLGITDGLIRVSVGLESVDDLSADIDSALAAVYG